MTDFQVAYKQPATLDGPLWDAFGCLMKLAQDGASRLEVREQIETLEAEMMKLPQVEQPLEHLFTDGLYGRRILNPQGSLLVTKIHKEPNFSFILSGRLGVISENGFEIFEGPRMFITKPGTKRVLYAQTDVVFITVHPNPQNVQDLEVLEDRIIAKSFDEIEIQAENIMELR